MQAGPEGDPSSSVAFPTGSCVRRCRKVRGGMTGPGSLNTSRALALVGGDPGRWVWLGRRVPGCALGLHLVLVELEPSFFSHTLP